MLVWMWPTQLKRAEHEAEMLPSPRTRTNAFTQQRQRFVMNTQHSHIRISMDSIVDAFVLHRMDIV